MQSHRPLCGRRKPKPYLAGRDLTEATIEHAAEIAASAARPISDIRGSADYRRDMVRVLVGRALHQVRDHTERTDWPAQPVLLWERVVQAPNTPASKK